MAYKDIVFTLDELRGSIFPIQIWEEIHKSLYQQTNKPFSIGDIVLKCGLNQAWNCIAYLNEYYKIENQDEFHRRFFHRVISPLLNRLVKSVSYSSLTEYIYSVEKYMRKEITKEILEQKYNDFLVYIYPDKYGQVDHDRHITFAYMLHNGIIEHCPDELLSLFSDICFHARENSSDQQYEIQCQTHDLVNMFPPVFKKFKTEEPAFWSQAIRYYKPNWVLKKLGFKSKDGRSLRFKWGSVAPQWGLSFELIEFNKTVNEVKQRWHLAFTLIFGYVWIDFPRTRFGTKFKQPDTHEIKHWGFSWGRTNSFQTLDLSWGLRRKYITLPWSLSFIRHSILMKDGTWQPVNWKDYGDNHEAYHLACEQFEANIAREYHSYRYVLDNAEQQYRIAAIEVHEREWRRAWLKKLPIFRHINRVIDVQFSDEVGERSGSWKGGVLGCSFDLKLDETPRECLKRMERTRKF